MNRRALAGIALWFLSLLVSGGVMGSGSALAADGDDAFTVIVLPDTQIYSQNHPHIFMAQTEWIAAMAEELDIRLVLHAGDVVNQGARSEEQWQNAKAALDVLDRAGIPTFIAIGNHDYDDEARTRGAEKFNEYFGIGRYEGAEWFAGAFEEGRSENVYGLIEAGGIPFLVLALEFGPRKAVLDWANEVIEGYPDRDVLVVTHAYMYYDDTRMSPGDSWNPKDYGVRDDASDGDDMWRALFSRHANVRMILSGHVLGTGVGRRIDAGEAGNAVHQILANYQMRGQGGEGYLRIMRFFPSRGIVEVTTYSPYLDRYLEDEAQQFLLTYDRSAGPPAVIQGKVVDAASGEPIAGAVVATRSSLDYYGIERSDEAGEFALRVPAGTYRLDVSKEGYLTGEVEIAAAAGETEAAVDLMPLPYARIAVGGVAPELADWTEWFSGVVDVAIELGPPALNPWARVQLARVALGEVFPLRELYQGEAPSDPIYIDTTALEDGTYEIAVEVEGMGGLTSRSVARFGVRNWEELVDDLLPPLQNAWFGEQSRKRTAAESEGWAYATDAPEAYFGDKDRLARLGSGEAWLVWEAPKLHDYEIVLYAADARDVERVAKVAVSPDGAAWTPVSFQYDAVQGPGEGLFRVTLRGAVPGEIGAAFLRLTLIGEEPSGVGAQLGQVRLRSYFAE